MGRPVRKRRVGFLPEVRSFRPGRVGSYGRVVLGVDEVESLRLCDMEGVDQAEACKKMGVSQSTFQRILVKARKKVAEGLVLGLGINIEGGDFIMPFGGGFRAGRGGGGRGRGRAQGPYQAGPGGVCQCVNPDCGEEVSHVVGQPCYTLKCPKCGSPMIRKR